MADEHPFASHLRTVGKGPNLSRPLDRGEAADAMRMILAGDAEPLQVGALLLLLRYRGETADEIAGFVEAARAEVAPAAAALPVELDWPSYADRHRQQPWFVLAALLLAEAGVPVLMHGIDGAHGEYAPTRPVLQALGMAPSATPSEAAAALQRRNFAYLGLETLLAPLDGLFDLRDRLGVRTAINTLARALNPASAAAQLIGVAHPPYIDTHLRVAQRLAQPRLSVWKGGGGEAQRNPLKTCRVATLRDGAEGETEWPPLAPSLRHDWRREDRAPARVARLWRGEIEAPAAEAAVIATAAVALWTVGRAATPDLAEERARELWQARSRTAAAARA